MSSSCDVVSHDHLDLLVSAAERLALLVPTATAAFSPAAAASAGLVGTPTAAGRLLLEENLAAARWRRDRGRGRLELPDGQLHYEHRTVARFGLMEVLKAAHAYQQLAADSPGWAGSAARRLVDAVVLAATQQLPGYAQASGRWIRLPARTAPPVGLRHLWAPVEHGVIWLPADQLAGRWEDATLVVLTVDALEDLPVGLPPRPGVYLCAASGIDDDLWPAITQLQPDVVVHVPAGRAWLLEQLADPAAALRRSDLELSLAAGCPA